MLGIVFPVFLAFGLGIFAAFVVAVLVVHYFVGGNDYHNSPKQTPTAGEPIGGRGVDAGAEKCISCWQIQAWWDSLSFWRSLKCGSFYYLQKIGCALMGC